MVVSGSPIDYPVHSEKNHDNEYFHQHAAMAGRSRRRLSTGRSYSIENSNASIDLGKKIGIIIGSIAGGLLLIGLIIGLIIFSRRNKKSMDITQTIRIKLTFFFCILASTR